MTSILKKMLSRNAAPSLKFLKKVNGKPMVDSINPGIHVIDDFISNSEELELLNETSELKKHFAFEGGSQIVSVDGRDKKISIDVFRVTGRPEVDGQKIAPWGYGDNFNIDLVPPVLRKLISKIGDTPHFAETDDVASSSKLRDITINFRSNAMFKMDPHIDPSEDGSHILHIGLGSDVVFTLTPDTSQLKKYAKPEGTKYDIKLPLNIRTVQSAIDTRSWTSEDIDALMKRKSLLYICGDARYEWKHAIRSGVDVGAPVNGICDWWGDINDSLVRRDNERVSIVLGYK